MAEMIEDLDLKLRKSEERFDRALQRAMEKQGKELKQKTDEVSREIMKRMAAQFDAWASELESMAKR